MSRPIRGNAWAKMIDRVPVLILCLFTVLLWGLWGFFGKLALQRGMMPLPVLGIETVTSAILVVIVLGIARSEWSVGAANWNFYGVLSGVSLALGLLFYYFALQRGSASITVALTSTYPVVATMLSVLLLKERLALPQWIGLVLIIVGIVLLVGGEVHAEGH